MARRLIEGAGYKDLLLLTRVFKGMGLILSEEPCLHTDIRRGISLSDIHFPLAGKMTKVFTVGVGRRFKTKLEWCMVFAEQILEFKKYVHNHISSLHYNQQLFRICRNGDTADVWDEFITQKKNANKSNI